MQADNQMNPIVKALQVTKKKGLAIAIGGMILFLASILYYYSTIPIVYVSRAEQKTARDIVFGIVEIKQFHLTNLRSERTGIVKETNYDIGDRVEKGSVVLTLDTEELEIEVEGLKIQKDFIEKNLELPLPIENRIQNNLLEFEIIEERFKQGQLPEDDYINARRKLEELEDQKKRDFLTQKLDLASSNNDIQRSEYSLNRMTLKSPINGTIVDISCRKGDLVAQGNTVATIIDQRRLTVASISEDDFDRVKEGLPLEMKLKAFPKQVFYGRVAQILPTLNSKSGKYDIYIESNLPEEKMLPGLTGEANIIANERKNAIVVPSQAVFQGYVLKVENNRISKVPVSTGFVSLLEIEILDGVEEGDLILTESNNLYEDGRWVRTRWE